MASTSSSVALGGSSGAFTSSLPIASASAPASRKRLPSMYSVKLPPSACVMKPDWPAFSSRSMPAGTMTAFTSRVRTNGSFSWLLMDSGLLLGLRGGSAAGERRVQRVPREARAFHAHREIPHAREGGELPQIFGDRRVVPREHFVDLVEQVIDLVAPFALHGFAHHRRGSDRDGATLAFEAQVGNPVAVETQRHVQPVAAQRVVTV